MTGPKQ